MTPIVDLKSRINFTPSSSRRPQLVGDLKLPIEKIDTAKNKLPILVEDLKLPVEKQSKPQAPVKETPKFLDSSKHQFNYSGKFHYPPEVDFNEVENAKDDKNERLDKFNNYRPKSTIVSFKLD